MTSGAARRVTALALCVATFVALSAMPAQAKTTSSPKWGAAFCGSLGKWADTVTSGANEIQTSLAGSGITPADGKTTILGYLGDIADATGDFYAGVKKAGNPDTGNGAKIQKTILTGIKGLEARVSEMQGLAQAIPTTDVGSFQTSVQALSAAFDSVSTPFDQAMDKVASLDKDDQLSKSLQKVKTCKAIFG